MDLFYQNSNTTLNIILKSQYLWLLITAIFSFPSHALDSHYVELESRKNITVPTLVLKPNNIDAAVILFAGGKGKIKILPSKYILKENNFLIRSRDLFAEQNLLVTILDIPSDRQEDGLLYNFRESKEHMQDISAAIDHIKTITNKPIWLVGTSRGSSSAIAGAIEIPDLISGIIISAPMTDENARGLDVPSMALRKINLPVYIAHHKKDPWRLWRIESSWFFRYRKKCD